VPKKPKNAEKETEGANASLEAKTSSAASRRARAGGKKSTASGKKTAAPRAKKPKKNSSANVRVMPTDEEIRIRAYFISERRHRFALPGDASADWVEARRQLLVEAGAR
jgi:hypothetical protein